MGEHVLSGDPPVAVRLRRSARARRLLLRVGGADGRVTLTLPPRVPLREGLAFLREREGWLRGHLRRLPPPAPPAWGAPVPFEGQEVVLAPGPAPGLDGDRLLLPPERPARSPARSLPGPPAGSSLAPPGPALLAFLKAAARDRLGAACARHAAALGRPHGRLSLRDARSRWGSCTARGDLMFSWRLVMAPPWVLDAVAAHEVAHLRHLDHSPAFWAAAEALAPRQREARAWLREHGARLHRVALP